MKMIDKRVSLRPKSVVREQVPRFAGWPHLQRLGAFARDLLHCWKAALWDKAKASSKLLFKSLEESISEGRRNPSQRPFNSQCALLDLKPISAGLSRGP
jgi:hypothetical protein